MEVWGKEIGVLQALTSTPLETQSEDLQFLVDELKSVIEEGALLKESKKIQRVVKRKSKSMELTDDVLDRSAESYETFQQGGEILPELHAKEPSSRNWKPRHGRIWEEFLL
jgi:hypothetical protein